MESQTQSIMDASVGEFYAALDERLRKVKHMNLARWKILQQTAVSLLVTWLAVEAGADATVAIGVIAIINGLSIAEIATILSGGTPPVEQPQDDDDKRQ